MQGVKVREVEDGDVDFIYSTWLRSYKYNSPITEAIRNDIFYPNHQEILEKILLNPETQTSLVVLEEDPRVILGYLVYTEPTIHFVYVKKPFRKEGVASLLFESLGLPKDIKGVQYSHLTWGSIELSKAGKWSGIYNPYLR